MDPSSSGPARHARASARTGGTLQRDDILGETGQRMRLFA